MVATEPVARRSPGRAPAHRRTGGRGEGFRRDIEGLRGLALIGVLLFHADVPFAPGGYIGLDIFFVMSGFLITSLIVGELETTGTVSLAKFYARRAKRILPMAVTVMVATVLLAAVVFGPVRRVDVAQDATGAALYVVNWVFAARAVDYFATNVDDSPLLHFWSLAVEEQFYFVWPVLILGVALVWRRVGRDPLPALRVTVVTVTVGLFAYGLYATYVSTEAAYFSTFARGWELALGAALALGVACPRRLSPTAAAALTWGGLGALLWALLSFDPDPQYPGWTALIPTLATAAVILGGSMRVQPAPNRGLEHPALAYLGRVSYAWYLWHWPLIVFAVAIWGELSPLAGTAVVLVAWVPSALTHRFIGEPFRRSRVLVKFPRRGLALGAVCSGLAVLVALGSQATTDRGTVADAGQVLGARSVGVSRSAVGAEQGRAASPGGDSADAAAAGAGSADAGSADAGSAGAGDGSSAGARPADNGPEIQRRADAVRPNPFDARDDRGRAHDDGCHIRLPDVNVPPCIYGDPQSSTTVVMWGDSKMMQYFNGIDVVARKKGWRLVALSKGRCPAADVTVYNTAFKRAYTECDQWRQKVLDRLLNREDPDMIITSESTVHTVVQSGKQLDAQASAAALEDGYVRTLRLLKRETGARLVVIRDNPRPKRYIPDCVAEHMDDLVKCASSGDQLEDFPPVNARAAKRVGARILNPAPLLCRDGVCPGVIGNAIVYRDAGHLTGTFAETLAPWFSRALPKPRS